MDTQGGPTPVTPSMVQHAIVHLVIAMEAGVEAQRGGNYAEAVSLLRNACTAGEQLAGRLPPAHASVVLRRLNVAQGRLQAAQAALAAQEDAAAMPPGTTLRVGAGHSFSAHLPCTYTPPPGSALLRPFWLLSLLGQSVHGTAWLTPSLRVDKGVWQQDGGSAVLSFIGEKTRLLERMARSLESTAALAPANPDLVSILSGCLQECAAGMSDFEAVALQEDGRVEQLGRIERGVRGLMSKSKGMLKSWNQHQVSTLGNYVVWAYKLCLCAERLQELLLACHSATDAPGTSSKTPSRLTEATDRLHRLAGLLLRGPCRFLLEDALLLANRAVTQRRNEFGKLDLSWEDTSTVLPAGAPPAA